LPLIQGLFADHLQVWRPVLQFQKLVGNGVRILHEIYLLRIRPFL